MEANASCGTTRKRRKLSSPQTPANPTSSRKRRSRLSFFSINDAPLDILYEVFSYLDALDVLRLSRTTQGLRRVLLNRSAVTVWRQAMRNSKNLPKKPEDMSEPQFVSLILDTHCEFCLRLRSKTYWEFRLRCCKTCFKPPNFAEWTEKHPHFKNLEKILPFVYDWERPGKMYYCPERIFRPIADGLDALETEEPEVLERWCDEKSAEFQPGKKIAKRLGKWAEKAEDNRERERRVVRKQREQDIRQRLCDLGWQQEIEFYEAHRLFIFDPPFGVSSKLVPGYGITRPLTDTDWKKMEPKLLQVMEDLKVKRLQRIRDENAHRIQTAFNKALDTFRSVLPYDTLRIGALDIARMDMFREYVELIPLDVDLASLSESEREDLLEELEDQTDELWLRFPTATLLWQTKHQLHLLSLIGKSPSAPLPQIRPPSFRSSSPFTPLRIFASLHALFALMGEQDRLMEMANNIDEDKSLNTLSVLGCDWFPLAAVQEATAPLQLATVAFRCTLPESEAGVEDAKPPCSEPIFYPRVLGHTCARRRREPPQPHADGTTTSPESEYMPEIFSYYPVYNQRGDYFAAYPEASTLIARLVTLCGLNPEVTTRKEMVELAPMLGCAHPTCCPKRYPHISKFGMRWEGAIAHALKAHADDLDNAHWRLLQGEDLKHAEECEAEMEAALKEESKVRKHVFTCMHCCHYGLVYKDVKEHLAKKHEVEEIEQGEDYTYHVDAPIEVVQPTVKLDWMAMARWRKAASAA